MGQTFSDDPTCITFSLMTVHTEIAGPNVIIIFHAIWRSDITTFKVLFALMWKLDNCTIQVQFVIFTPSPTNRTAPAAHTSN